MQIDSQLEGIGELSPDRIYALLSDRRRCYAVDCLAARESSVVLEDLAVAVAAREGDSDGVSADAIADAAAALHHVHVPKLASAGLVDYDPETNVVEPDGVERLARFIDGEAA